MKNMYTRSKTLQEHFESRKSLGNSKDYGLQRQNLDRLSVSKGPDSKVTFSAQVLLYRPDNRYIHEFQRIKGIESFESAEKLSRLLFSIKIYDDMINAGLGGFKNYLQEKLKSFEEKFEILGVREKLK